VREIKKKTSITIDENLVKQAKDNKLNISALAEKAIKNALNETNYLQRLKIRKTKLKQQIEQNTLELERVEELIETEIKESRYKIKEEKFKIQERKNKIILGFAIIGLIGMLALPFMSNNLMSSSEDDFIVKNKGMESKVIIPNWMGTAKFVNYSFSDDDNVTIVKIRNPSYLILD